MSFEKYLCKSLIIFLVFSSIFINASTLLKKNSVAKEQSNKGVIIIKPTKPTSPKKPDSHCNGSKSETEGKVILTATKESPGASSDSNSGVAAADNGSTGASNGKGGKSDSNLSGHPEIAKMKATWFDTKLKAKDLGVNSQGELYVVGADSKLYLYEFISNTYLHIEGHFELTKINRVDVSWEDIPYVITETGDTYYLSCDHRWMRLSGCASDIGIGRGGEVYKTGCDERESGFGIYKLFCSSNVNCGYNGCLNFRKPKTFEWTHKGSERECEWFRIDGNGVKIDVAPNGNPYVIDKNGEIQHFDGMEWRNIPTKVKAYDLSISNNGIVFYIGQDANIYKSQNENSGTWIQIEGEGVAISVGPLDHPWVVSRAEFSVIGTAKNDYN